MNDDEPMRWRWAVQVSAGRDFAMRQHETLDGAEASTRFFATEIPPGGRVRLLARYEAVMYGGCHLHCGEWIERDERTAERPLGHRTS